MICARILLEPAELSVIGRPSMKALITSNSLPDLPSGGRDRPVVIGIICPKAKYPANQKCSDPNVFIQAINYLQGEEENEEFV